MTKKTTEICVRVSENEKQILQRKAKKCGLSLSGYLRKSGLEQEVYEIPDERLYKIYNGILTLKHEFPVLQNNDKIRQIQSDFLDIYNAKKGDD